MRLTLCSAEKTVGIDIPAESYLRLRSPALSDEELERIAAECDVSPALLSGYVHELNKELREAIELDGSCDYSDHL